MRTRFGAQKASIALAALVLPAVLPLAMAGPAPLPKRLIDTGLYVDGWTVRPGIIPFSPQYPLWSDGAAKRRWIALPQGGAIDATRPGAWVFPRGTRLWKEFSVGGRRVETRLIERAADGDWRYATYVWNEEGSDAKLAPVEGIAALPLPGGRRYAIPSEADCRACHEGAAAPVLGFSALQLSADRDPLAPHAEPRRPGDPDLRDLVARGWLRGLPQALFDTPPRIAAPTPAGRAALGYLHANCGHCHVDPAASGAAVPVGLSLWLDPADAAAGEKTLRSLVEGASRFRPSGGGATRLLAPGDAAASVLVARMRSRNPRVQMPPIASAVPDAEALALIERWVKHDLSTRQETPQ